MPKVTLNKTMQIGIVVRDLKQSIKHYEDSFGVGPWDTFEFIDAKLNEYGKPVERSWRGASAMVGGVQWELIEPLDDESVFARFLSEKGEGVHHIAVATPSYEATLAAHSSSQHPPVLEGTFYGIRCAYLNTATELGVLVEISDLTDS